MNEIIAVNSITGTVSARELHERLKIGTRFNDWFARMCEYGFLEGMDFYSKMSKTDSGGRPPMDYNISLDMAKHVCMYRGLRRESGADNTLLTWKRRGILQSK